MAGMKAFRALLFVAAALAATVTLEASTLLASDGQIHALVLTPARICVACAP